MSTTNTTPTLGELLSAAQSEALDGLAYIKDATAGRLRQVAERAYSAILVSDPLDRLHVTNFVVDFGGTFPGEVEAVVRYAALRDAWTEVQP